MVKSTQDAVGARQDVILKVRLSLYLSHIYFFNSGPNFVHRWSSYRKRRFRLLISPSVFEAAAIRRSNLLKSSNLITLHPQSSSFCRITQQDIAGHKGTIGIGDVQVDSDMGNYEPFLDVTLTEDNNITTGKIYQALHFEVGSLGII
ncbi:uncharacterized protein LOC126622885 [Malus sylvestris]|uniref:uncharacterized protein LOC126622885 n=1 Tax=Malus sylvestris TaxID=3752 RepID=UPI0021AC79C8|nr:uncharacterized protein LOC126622885 [Malus sylvestris]